MLYAADVLSFQKGSYLTDTLITFLLGLGIVFVGLIALVAIIKIMGFFLKKIVVQGKDVALSEKSSNETNAFTTVSSANRQQFIAAVSAALATVMGNDVSAIRIKSVKRISE